MTEPTFTIIVPVYNDPPGIEQTVSSLLNVDYPRTDHEIIVVDNESTDETREIATNLVSDHDHAHIAVQSEFQTSYATRNKGIELASGEIFAFVDADMTVPKTWLTNLATIFETTEADYVGCNVELYIPNGKSTLIATYNLAAGFPVEYYLEELNFAPTCCLAVRREVINDVGPFTPDLVSGEDVEFGRRVAAAGYTQRFASDVTMYHPARTTLAELISKAMRHGKGREQRHQYYKKNKQSRPWYHFRNFLPPHPKRLWARISDTSSVRLFPLFYIIAYIEKLAEAVGQSRTCLT